MNVFSSINPQNLIYLDIETVPCEKNFRDLSPQLQKLWIKKSGVQKDVDEYKFNKEKDVDISEIIYQDSWDGGAALYSEYNKIVAIVVGGYNNNGEFNTKSFYGTDEKSVLMDFKNTLDNSLYNNRRLIAHNGKGFDYPVLFKRYIINGIEPPKKLWDLFGKKPWEITLLDTMEIWKFGGYGSNHTASLETLSTIFGLPSPKEDMDGSQVGAFFYNNTDSDEGIEKIAKYCTNDVICLCQVVLSITNSDMPLPPFIK